MYGWMGGEWLWAAVAVQSGLLAPRFMSECNNNQPASQPASQPVRQPATDAAYLDAFSTYMYCMLCWPRSVSYRGAERKRKGSSSPPGCRTGPSGRRQWLAGCASTVELCSCSKQQQSVVAWLQLRRL
ncbi:hypothetical protein IWX47DRAFT_226677 [Phyllosticta citricarpa]